MTRLLIAALVAVSAYAADSVYDLAGHIQPEGVAAVSVFGATTPFRDAGISDSSGRFSFKKLAPGAYTIAVFFSDRGEARQTIEVGPGTADDRHRVNLNLEFKESDFVFADPMRRRHAVSARQLSVPDRAVRDYQDAQAALKRHDTDSAVKSLEHAVEIAPQFSAAWNELGTIAYQTRKFDRAEECFRQSLAQDPDAYEPLVNLGGVLVTLQRTDESLDYNIRAVLARPNDALANSQLGQSYFQASNYELALKYLERARILDPAHFSHPQLVMAEIHLRQGDRVAAAADLDDFLKHHPDWPKADAMRKAIADFRP
ncbi:MAG TPA: tetratricopeptide repeat protein [Bryobacteraceae bacterium]|nr:tetratricopeptide repeat protein [Bryobacteraceae bacterium]